MRGMAAFIIIFSIIFIAALALAALGLALVRKGRRAELPATQRGRKALDDNEAELKDIVTRTASFHKISGARQAPRK